MRLLLVLIAALFSLAGPAFAEASPSWMNGVLAGRARAASGVSLADGKGLWIPPYSVFTPGIGVKGGFTNSTQWTLIYSLTQAGADLTNKQNAGIGIATDPATHAECSGGVSRGIFLDFYDGSTTGLVGNFNGTSGVVGTTPPLGCEQFPSGAGARNIPATPTIFVIAMDSVAGNWSFFRNDTDVGLHGTAAVGKTTLNANTISDFNADSITAGPCAACGIYFGNIPNTSIGIGALSLNFAMLLEGRTLVCTAADATAGTKTVTGWGVGTCPTADTIPAEFIAKIVDPTTKYLKEPGAGGVNFDSDGTKSVWVFRTRSGALTTNEGSGTATFSEVFNAGHSYVDPAHYGPYEACVGGGGPPASGSYCWGLAQLRDAKGTAYAVGTTGSIEQGNGKQPGAIGDGQILAGVARQTSNTGIHGPIGIVWHCPDGTWTLTQSAVDRNGWVDLAFCTRVVTTSGQAAEGDPSAPFIMTFDSHTGPVGQEGAALITYRNVSSFGTPVCAVLAGDNLPGATTFTAPTVTTTQANETVVTIFAREAANAAWSPTGLGVLRVRGRSQPASGPLIAIVDHVEATAGTSTAETASGSQDGWSACVIPVVH